LSANTGTIDLPPSAPAAAWTVSVPVNDALTAAESSEPPKRTPLSILEMKSMPVTPTAMPAPMPTLSEELPVTGMNGSV